MRKILVLLGLIFFSVLREVKKGYSLFYMLPNIFLTTSNQETVKKVLLHPFFWTKVKADKLIYEDSTVDKS